MLAEDRAALLYLANLACIDHNPFMSRAGSIENPDWILIDLDPQECSFDRIVEAALLVRKKLDILELEGYPKTTGGDGMHIYVPVEPHYSYEQTKSFAEVIARTLAGEHPDLFTTPRSVAKRQKNRVYFDYLQNGEGKTIAAPYVIRAYDGAPVATPLRWDEVKLGLYPTQFTIRNAAQRFEARGRPVRGGSAQAAVVAPSRRVAGQIGVCVTAFRLSSLRRKPVSKNRRIARNHSHPIHRASRRRRNNLAGFTQRLHRTPRLHRAQANLERTAARQRSHKQHSRRFSDTNRARRGHVVKRNRPGPPC